MKRQSIMILVAISFLLGCTTLQPVNQTADLEVFKKYIYDVVIRKGMNLKEVTNFKDIAFEKWGGNLYSSNESEEYVEFKGNNNWEFINKPNNISFGTDIFYVIQFSSGSQFNTALTHGYWDNDTDEIKISFGLSDAYDSADLIRIFSDEGKTSTKKVNRWKQKKIVTKPGKIYLVHYEIDKDGSVTMSIIDNALNKNICRWPEALPNTLYSHEFTINKGLMKLYFYEEYVY